MNRKFALRLGMTPKTRTVSSPDNKAEAEVARRSIEPRAEQIEQEFE